MLLNGNKVQNPHGVMAIADRLWNRAVGIPDDVNYGLVHHCLVGRDGDRHENGIMMRRDDPCFDRMVMDCRTWSAYIAKYIPDDEQLSPHVRRFGASVLPKA